MITQADAAFRLAIRAHLQRHFPGTWEAVETEFFEEPMKVVLTVRPDEMRLFFEAGWQAARGVRRVYDGKSRRWDPQRRTWVRKP